VDKDFTPEQVVRLAEEAGFEIIERAELPGREAKPAAIPQCVHPAVAQYLSEKYPKGLYSHQAEAIQVCLGKQDVCITTATASGKTDVYSAVAADMVLRDPNARVLALYPARALIQDQLTRWCDFRQLGLTVGYIDGGVAVEQRPGILHGNHIVLMTPDVAHAWLLNKAGEAAIGQFLQNLRLLVLDEAHVYEGVFGTNMAYFLRRLEATAGTAYLIIVTTATLGEPEEFISKLTGRVAKCSTDADDGSSVPRKTLLLARGAGFSDTAKLLQGLASQGKSPFLAFADSRKQVEQLVAAARRQGEKTKGKEDSTDLDKENTNTLHEETAALDSEDTDDEVLLGTILPYRAGYEAEDRVRIQKALGHGELAGVVSTSALELGIDIGEISLVVLLTTPPSAKAFHQRVGRGGRRRPGVCLILDTAYTISLEGLESYLNRPIEPNWLYLDNRYVQYANALCAAHELRQRGSESIDTKVFATLPQTFKAFLENEVQPTQPVPDDLFRLKQQAEAGPHFEFPLRSGIEKQFSVKERGGWTDRNLGSLTFSQMLREAYPGAIYYYMARPYRVQQFMYRAGEVLVRRERYWTTEPISQTMVFPNLQGGVLKLWVTEDRKGFLAEASLQVSDRVSGFREKRGSAQPESHLYGPGSPYYQRPLNNFFETTGVCWFFPDLASDEDMALLLREAFCSEFGIVERDIGVGTFISRTSPIGLSEAAGYCIYDATAGSLRLTQMLAEHFGEVVDTALKLANARDDTPERVQTNLSYLADATKELVYVSEEQRRVPSFSRVSESQGDRTVVIAPGEKAIVMVDTPKEVTVLTYRYTPKGIMYDLEHPVLQRWSVPANQVKPIYGETKMLRVNLVTNEAESLGHYSELLGKGEF